MVYATVANVRVMFGFASNDTTSMPDATIAIYQAIADDLILAFIASPNAYGAKIVEARLCYMLYQNSNIAQIHRDLGGSGSATLNQIELTEEMKLLLSGQQTSDILYGYTPYDYEVS